MALGYESTVWNILKLWVLCLACSLDLGCQVHASLPKSLGLKWFRCLFWGTIDDVPIEGCQWKVIWVKIPAHMMILNTDLLIFAKVGLNTCDFKGGNSLMNQTNAQILGPCSWLRVSLRPINGNKAYICPVRPVIMPHFHLLLFLSFDRFDDEATGFSFSHFSSARYDSTAASRS
jgi:hypothetical protein